MGKMLACVAGGIRERASGRAAILSPWRNFRLPHFVWLPPTFITFDDPIK